MQKETCPRGSSKNKILSSSIPSCPASGHSPLQPLGTPINGIWQVHASFSLPSFRVVSRRQESWARTPVTGAEARNSIGLYDAKVTISMVICFSSFTSAFQHVKFAHILQSLLQITSTHQVGFYPFFFFFSQYYLKVQYSTISTQPTTTMVKRLGKKSALSGFLTTSSNRLWGLFD